MTTEQAAELKRLRKDEAQKLKDVTQLERRLRSQIQRTEAAGIKAGRQLDRSTRKAQAMLSRETIKRIKPLRTQLHKLSEGRVPEASALAAIRKRIAVLEQRLTS